MPSRPQEASAFPSRRNARVETASPCPSEDCVGIFITGVALPDDFQTRVRREWNSPRTSRHRDSTPNREQRPASRPIRRARSCEASSKLCTAPVRLVNANFFPSGDQHIRAKSPDRCRRSIRLDRLIESVLFRKLPELNHPGLVAGRQGLFLSIVPGKAKHPAAGMPDFRAVGAFSFSRQKCRPRSEPAAIRSPLAETARECSGTPLSYEIAARN